MKALIILFFAGLIQICTLQAQDNRLTPVKSQTKRVTYKPAFVQEMKSVRLIPDLQIKDFAFSDGNSNKVIGYDERDQLNLNLVNEGKGIAEDVIFKVTTEVAIRGLSFQSEFKLGNIAPDQVIPIKIPISTDLSLQDGAATFVMVAVEKNGYDSEALPVTINTRKFQEPNVRVVDYLFTTEEGGKIRANYPVNLKVMVQNVGFGTAADVTAEFHFTENCNPGDTTFFNIGSLLPGDIKTLEFPFTFTRRYAYNEIPVRIDLEEKFGRFAEDTIAKVGINQSLQARQPVVIEPAPLEKIKIEYGTLTAEVDRNIPENPQKFDNRIALVIGNEDYTKYQSGLSNEADVKFARQDAEIFKNYLIRTLGFREETVFLLLDGTAAQMNQSIDRVASLAQRTPDAEIVFYYSGHGLPDQMSNVPYLIPVDGNGSNLSTAVKLIDVCNKLGNSEANKVSFYLDACFSGAGREKELIASRGIRVKPKLEIPPANTIIFSASSGDQKAFAYDSKQHGMFTYFLLKKLQDTRGDLTYGELADYLRTVVGRQSLIENRAPQDPDVIFGNNDSSRWVNVKLK